MNDKITLATLKRFKEESRPISVLTCYDYSVAVLLQDAGVDSLLVGDSLAQTVLGYPSTLNADMDLMLTLTAAVRRGAPYVYLIGDMPFLSYTISQDQTLRNAGRFMTEGGCDVVKLEVDERHVDTVYQLSRAGIPVMAHLGYRPQSSRVEDRIVQTRQVEKAVQLVHDAQAMIEAGAVGLLLECVTDIVAQEVTRRCPQPVISCGSGPGCDGQVLVLHEILGMPGAAKPKFTQQFGDIGQQICQAGKAYVQAVVEKQFPTEEHCYHMTSQAREEFLEKIQ